MLHDRLAAQAQPVNGPADLDLLLDAVGDRQVVLLGEASHGTHDYYAWRARISERLMREKGFRFVAVEGDWPECAALDAWIAGRGGEGARGFHRWPTWMWGNREIDDFVRAMRRMRADGLDVRFHGLDVYSLAESLDRLRADFPDDVSVADALACFDGRQHEGESYGWGALVGEGCRDEAVRLLARMANERFDAEQNALVVRNAEAYYRAMVQGGAESWNVRDRHMQTTLERLVEREGKAIVWAHNTHVGDARFTDMRSDGMVNLGQLCRERFGHEEVFILGFTSHAGRVIASRRWDGPVLRMPLPRAEAESWDALLHEALPADFLLLMDGLRDDDEMLEARGQRAVGVVYDPRRERGNYVPTVLPHRYDAILHVDESAALEPLGIVADHEEAPQTFPFGQ